MSKKLHRISTPLGVIALFISLTEFILGTAVMKTSGNTQMALTLFVVLFPVFVAYNFFRLLKSNHFWKMYAPSEYPGLSGEQFMQGSMDIIQMQDSLESRINESMTRGLGAKDAVKTAFQSVLAKEQTAIKFTNLSGQVVNGFWVDYEGNEKPYFTLLPQQSHIQHTFETHPWVIRATDSNTELCRTVATSRPQHIDIK